MSKSAVHRATIHDQLLVQRDGDRWFVRGSDCCTSVIRNLEAAGANGRRAPIHPCKEQSLVRIESMDGSVRPVSTVQRTDAHVDREWRVSCAAVT